ncbi:MAG: sigma-54 dependent transcriptional regulator [Prevotellaceae bacterium]|jgi:DNA-binding NtrC family response regulator|nr:sigma-54 dependent transcriptional regulator [Prevotellaceae bacterium]
MKILIIDDDRSIRNTLKGILEYEKYSVSLAGNGADALQLARQTAFDMAFCDIKMEGMDGVEVLEKLQAIRPDLPVVMISGHGSIDTAVECIKKGAYDYLEKPLDLNRILICVRNAGERAHLVNETKNLKRQIGKTPEIIGASAAIMHIRELIERVAPTDARVLITGPSGTGKELVARWLHEKSRRAAGPFIEVNCAAIPGELIESELFGHEKGSFTSAIKQHKGKFEQAHGGTLFLDEIGDMSPAAQAKVLRVLQENRITRIGSDADLSVDVRVVAATNKRLQDEMERGAFRDDLYHRIGVIIIHVPALDERRDDIPLLADFFITQICADYGRARPVITADAIARLQGQRWKGNIREFRNVIERLIILCDKTITENDVERYANPAGGPG